VKKRESNLKIRNEIVIKVKFIMMDRLIPILSHPLSCAPRKRFSLHGFFRAEVDSLSPQPGPRNPKAHLPCIILLR